MNILFRKNLSEGGGGSKERFGKSAPRGSRGKVKAKPRPSTAFEDHYGLRTHIFLSPALQSETSDWGQRDSTSGIQSRYSSSEGISTGITSRRPSLQLKVSFSDVGGYANRTRKPISLLPVPKAEISQLKMLDKDCFIIPVASLDRFLPAGVPMPLLDNDAERSLSVLEVDDPKICIVIHLMTQMEPLEPILESPLTLPYIKQKMVASDLLSEIGCTRTAAEGMLLCNLEKNAEFPFIAYYVINKATTDPAEFFHNCRAASLRKFDPRTMRYTAVHTFDLFNEVATIARPPLDPTSKKPSSPSTGFIVSLYKVFEGDDGEKFEKNWLYWTGARMIYRALPKSVGLRRITLHKSASNGDKLYLLIVECSNFLEQLNAAAALIPALRARLCGYTGLYKTSAVF
ncbi:uncharacterized protein [Halyomorpha halys]|uniref:uncharacterized protein isoform X2 n=1 Tax=Halyomorpha halys TaxID=286706 RepID=UPI0006D50E52|nr:uncharacterized protein LOC106680352 isoform X2 [Halyomorpha halys]